MTIFLGIFYSRYAKYIMFLAHRTLRIMIIFVEASLLIQFLTQTTRKIAENGHLPPKDYDFLQKYRIFKGIIAEIHRVEHISIPFSAGKVSLYNSGYLKTIF